MTSTGVTKSKTCLSKHDVDLLYHNLRRVYLSADIQEKEAISGIVSHLTKPTATVGDYGGLACFLAWYGEKFLLEPTVNILTNAGVKPRRIVELGAGLAWLGRGLSYAFRDPFPKPAVFVDKREWTMIDVVANIETERGVQRVLDILMPGDLIVMSELLHCLDDPVKVLSNFAEWPMLIIEYLPMHREENMLAVKDSYFRQIEAFGCKPVPSISYVLKEVGVAFSTYALTPHVVVLTHPIKEVNNEEH